ncbi:hypothetical protein Prudu_013588 [Prunus dulcis]|uniref:Uncharacterized protein n=1 Tax=Prunus dulcis TaxID=3755 RepID=A0A4Y1RF48_PRUDU|nr:hypothetical protein Prudu_013588 [Prunus dulcis]
MQCSEVGDDDDGEEARKAEALLRQFNESEIIRTACAAIESSKLMQEKHREIPSYSRRKQRKRDSADRGMGKHHGMQKEVWVWPKGASNGYNDIAATTTTVYKLYKDYLQNPKRDIICDGGNYAMESSLTFLTYKGSVPYPKQKKKKVLMYSDVGFIYAGHFFTEPDYNRLQLLQGERPSMVEEGQWIYHTPT